MYNQTSLIMGKTTFPLTGYIAGFLPPSTGITAPGVVVQPLELETQRLMRHVLLRSTLQDLALEVVTEATRGRWRGDRLVRKETVVLWIYGICIIYIIYICIYDFMILDVSV